MILPASAGSLSSALPSPLPATFGTGHPMLISRIWKEYSSRVAATSPISSGSDPKICKDTIPSSGAVFSMAYVFLFLKERALAEIISVHTIPAPISAHNTRKGRSVTPAIGASIYGFGSVTLPICIASPFDVTTGTVPLVTFYFCRHGDCPSGDIFYKQGITLLDLSMILLVY